MPPQQYVTLVAEGGTPVTLADARGNPYPTTGYGGLVFDRTPTLYYPTLVGAIYDSTAGFARGTVDAPPVFFLGDLETGIYSPGAGLVGITNNGTESLRTDADGDTTLTRDLYIGGAVKGGLWNGTAISADYGGTGITSYAVGDLLYASDATTLSKLAGVATGNVLLSGGVATAPAWGKVNLAQHVSGNLPVTNLNSGTGATSSTYWRGDGTWSVPVFSVAVGSSPVSGSPTGRVLYNNGGTLGAYPITGSTNVVMSQGPTIATPTITGALTYGGVALSAAVTGTGPMVLGASPTITGALTYGGVTLTSAVTGAGKMVLDTAPTITNLTLTGTLTLGTPLPRTSGGTGGASISAGLDAEFSNARGSLLYRGAGAWVALAPGTAGYVLATAGAGADPAWTAAAAGNVVSSGTPTNGQLAGWNSVSSIQGITIGTGLTLAGTTLNSTAINQSSVAPTVHLLTSGTSFPRPAGGLWGRFRAVGGGGGAGGGGATNGGATTVDGVVANGGTAGGSAAGAAGAQGGAGGTGGSGTADLRSPGAPGTGSYSDGASAAFGVGGSSLLGGGSNSGGAAGYGGGGAGSGGGTDAVGGGGSGEYIEKLLSPWPATLSYAIGTGGTGGSGSNGGQGAVILEIHYNY